MITFEAWNHYCHASSYQEVAAYPADHYFLVEDKPDILQTVKQSLGDQVTTIFVRQGKYAAALVAGGSEPEIVLDSIAEFTKLDLVVLAQGAAYDAG